MTQTLPSRFMLIDCESVGLYGEIYAVGWLLVENGEITARGLVSCDPNLAEGSESDRKWISEHVPELPINCDNPLEVRRKFWDSYAAHGYPNIMGDVIYPVEVGFLYDLVQDEPERANWIPWPVYDAASIRQGMGRNAEGDYRSAHDPVEDNLLALESIK